MVLSFVEVLYVEVNACGTKPPLLSVITHQSPANFPVVVPSGSGSPPSSHEEKRGNYN